jgi:hypothetical protein
LISRAQQIACCGRGIDEQLCKEHKWWVEESIHTGWNIRQQEWTESIAVGSENFVQAGSFFCVYADERLGGAFVFGLQTRGDTDRRPGEICDSNDSWL